MIRRTGLWLVAALATVVPALHAQTPLRLPDVSPAASTSQVVGVTGLSVAYHRPAVNGRTIWGGQVPYDQVWRAGANENTVFETSTPIVFGGHALAAGRYGLHLLPTADGDWTLILSHMADAWGSFSYDESEDALRVPVKPEAAPFLERLGYSFDDLGTDSVTLALRWEKVRVAVPIEVDVQKYGLAEIRRQLRGLPRFGWVGWNQAANWARQNGGDLEEAEAWVDRSIQLQRTFPNLQTKAAILRATGRADEAKEITSEGFAIATEAQINGYGYQLLFGGDPEGAVDVFRRNTVDHPESWNVWDSLAESLAATGDTKGAIANYEKALSMVGDDANRQRIRGILENLRAKK